MELGDSSDTSGLVALFCARLKRLQGAAGISQAGLAAGVHLGSSQMSDILNGRIKRLPGWDVTIAMIRACLRYAEARGTVVPPDLCDERDWRRRYADLEHDLDARVRSRPRREMQSGRLLGEVTDPFALEVHRPVQPDAPQRGLPALPAYLPREHDVVLERVAEAAVQGTSGIAVLVGGSSTGKTRACWEALALLRRGPKPWRLWHPIDPTRPEAALRELPSIGPRTVVWLNEAQFYLDVAAGGLGERIAAGLRELLRDSARAPVLVLATLWPQYWAALTARPAAGADPHAQARELLAGRDISVPAAFTADQLRQLPDAEDPRLAQAAKAAENGQVIQFLAGAPELMTRYRNAPAAAAALVDAAIDARRLGMGIALPLAFLGAAAPGYLADTDWDGLGEDWLEQALAYTAAPCNGIRGPLTRIRPRTSRFDGSAGEPAYRLADYLEQDGRRSRRLVIPPAGFWDAAASFAGPADLPALARAAGSHGLLRDAARLRKRAALEDASEAVALVRHWHFLHPDKTDPTPAQWAVAHTALGDPYAAARLLSALREAGAQQPAADLATRAAAHVSLDNPAAVARLLGALREAGAEQQAAAILDRNPAAHATLDDPASVAELLGALRRAGAHQQAADLATRAAAHAPIDDPAAVARILDALRAAGAHQQAADLATRAAAHAPIDNPAAVAVLLRALRRAGAHGQAADLAIRAAAHTALEDPYAVARTLNVLREAGAEQQAAAMLGRDPAAHAALDNPAAVAELLDVLRDAGADQQAGALATRAAARAPIDDPAAVAWLLGTLREVGAEQQAAAVLARNPAAHAALNDPAGVAWLLGALREAGAEQQAADLATRAAAHATLDRSASVARLLSALREAGAEQQARTLVDRLPAEGWFDLFREQPGHEIRFRFGRELDGNPAPSWGWDDLD